MKLMTVGKERRNHLYGPTQKSTGKGHTALYEISLRCRAHR
jgi:hypothetical protein